MTGIYYTTAEIKNIFRWKSDTTVYRKLNSGFLPDPDLPGSPNKWLKSTIDAIVGAKKDNSVDPDIGTQSPNN